MSKFISKRDDSKRKFKCEVCNTFVTSQKCLEVHKRGRGHALKQEDWDLKNSMRDLTAEYILYNGTSSFTCTLCTYVASSLVELKCHVDDQAHKDMLKYHQDSKNISGMFNFPMINIDQLKTTKLASKSIPKTVTDLDKEKFTKNASQTNITLPDEKSSTEFKKRGRKRKFSFSGI